MTVNSSRQFHKNDSAAMAPLRLFMLLLGSKPPGRHIEQHDVFFGIAGTLNELVPEIKSFWSHSNEVHIDAWREVTTVENYKVLIDLKTENIAAESPRLFFINL